MDLLIYLGIGALVNLYLHYKNQDKINALISSGQIGVVMLTGILTHFTWPIMLYKHFNGKWP